MVPPLAEGGTVIFDHSLLDGLKSGMKPSDLQEIVDSLHTTLRDILEALNSAAASGDMDTIRARAHEMKGMCGNFGLKEMSDLAWRIEKTVKDGESTDGLSEIIASLPEAQARALSAIETWIKS